MLDVSDMTSHWRVLKIGDAPLGETMNNVEQWRRKYRGFRDLPRKTQEAVAVLRMCDLGEHLTGVGCKVSDNTFWIDDQPELLAEYEDEAKPK